MAITQRDTGGIKVFYGLAGDAKPTTDVPAGSTFHVIDTGADYVFDGTSWDVLLGQAGLPTSTGPKSTALSTSVTMALGDVLTSRSGTITTGGTRQQAAAANAARRYLLIQNPTTATESFWIRFGANAAAASPSIEFVPGATLIWEGSFIPTQAIDVIAATIGTAFTVHEG